MADEVRGAQLEIVFLAGRNTPQAPHRLNDFTLRRFHVYVLRNRERHNQFFRLRVLLLEAAQGNYGEDIHAGSDKQALVVLEHADHFVNAAVDTHSLAEGVSVGEERFADGRSKDDYWARMLLVEDADEASTLDAEKGDGVDVLWLGATHDDLLDAIVPAGDQIRIAEEKAPRADGGQCLHVGSGVADKTGIVVFKILAGANAFRPAGRIRARRKSRDKVGAGAERFHAVLHKLVEALDDRGHGDHRGDPDNDTEHSQCGAHFGRTQRLHGRKKVFASLRKRHNSHQSDLKATTGSSCEARTAG